MGNIIKVLQIVLGIIPQIIAIIQAIEVPGQGALKLATVIGIVKATLESLPEVSALIGVDKIAPWIEKVVSILVGFLNAVGIFKKTP